jgi:small multidrug resistance pump
MKYVIALFVALALNASANLLMKVGTKPVHEAGGIMQDGILAAVRTVLTSAPLMIGLVCFGLNAAFYIYALQSPALKISIAYPIMVGGGYALIATIACLHPTLAERLTAGQWLGVALVLIGIVLIAAQTETQAG